MDADLCPRTHTVFAFGDTHLHPHRYQIGSSHCVHAAAASQVTGIGLPACRSAEHPCRQNTALTRVYAQVCPCERGLKPAIPSRDIHPELKHYFWPERFFKGSTCFQFGDCLLREGSGFTRHKGEGHHHRSTVYIAAVFSSRPDDQLPIFVLLGISLASHF